MDMSAKDVAAQLLRAGIWMIRNGYGRTMILPYASPSGMHWRCEFHSLERDNNGHLLVFYRYSSAQRSQFLQNDEHLLMQPSMTVQVIAEIIVANADPKILSACKGPTSQEMESWLGELEEVLAKDMLPEAFNDGSEITENWLLLGGQNGGGHFMNAQPGYKRSGER